MKILFKTSLLFFFAAGLSGCAPKEEQAAPEEHKYEQLSSVTSKATSAEKSFSADLDVIVSFAQGSIAFIEDSSGGVMIESNGHGLVGGKELKGVITGKIIAYDGKNPYVGPGSAKITSINTSQAEMGNASTPLTVITLADLEKNFSRYAGCRVRFNGVATTKAMDAKNTVGEFRQADKVMVLQASGTKETVIYEGRTGDLIGFPYYNKDGKCVLIYGTTNFIERDLPAEDSKFTALTGYGAYDLTDENNPKSLYTPANYSQISFRKSSDTRTAHVSSILEDKDLKIVLHTIKISCGAYFNSEVYPHGFDIPKAGEQVLNCVKKESDKIWLRNTSDKTGYIIPLK